MADQSVASCCLGVCQFAFFIALGTLFWNGEWRHASLIDYLAFYVAMFCQMFTMMTNRIFSRFPYIQEVIAEVVKVLLVISGSCSMFDSASELSIEYRVILGLRIAPYFLSRRFYLRLYILWVYVIIFPFVLCEWCWCRPQHRNDVVHIDWTQLPETIATGEGGHQCFCLESLSAGDTIRTLPCRHAFHQPCIDMWLKRKATCPYCIAPVPLIAPVPVANEAAV